MSVWLCQIAKNLLFDYYRKNKRILDIEEKELFDIQALENVEEQLILKDEKLSLYRKMQKLDEKSRELIYLRMVGNLDFSEIGEVLGKTANWARVNFYRAKQKIREVNESGKENRM